MKQSATQQIFKALADPTRRAILERLARQELTVSAIAAEFEMSRPAVTKHLRRLQQSGLINVTAKGRERINHINLENLQLAKNYLHKFDQFWDSKLSRLKQEVENQYD
ncbi:MAG: ArsR/SmtB family transcription factor [bacterium]